MSGTKAEIAALVVAARGLRCRYPNRGDTCDDHRARKTPDFTRCDACVVRDLAAAITERSTPE